MTGAGKEEALCADCVGCLDDDGYCQACEGQREPLTVYQAYKRGLSDSVLTNAATAYMNAISDLGAVNPASKLTYFEESPSKNDECFRRWLQLNDAGKVLTAAIHRARTGEVS